MSVIYAWLKALLRTTEKKPIHDIATKMWEKTCILTSYHIIMPNGLKTYVWNIQLFLARQQWMDFTASTVKPDLTEFSTQELNLGSLDENQESQPPDQQGLEAKSYFPLTLARTEKCISHGSKNLKCRYKVYYQRHSRARSGRGRWET